MKTSHRSREVICADIEALVQEPGYIFTLVIMLYDELFLNPSEAADINWRERLSFQEFTFIAGLLAKYPLNLSQTDEETTKRQAEQTHKLFEELHWEHNSHWLDKLVSKMPVEEATEQDLDLATKELFGDGMMMTEPIFYSGSGAYDFQYWEFAPIKYQFDKDWLIKNNGLNIVEAAKIVETIKKAKGVKPPKLPESLADLNNQILDLFCISKQDLSDFADDDVAAIFDNFSLEFGKANKDLKLPGQYNQLSSHPLIRLDAERYFLPVHFALSQSLYESPYYWMQQDRAYRDVALSNRGLTTELITENLLVSVFGRDKVFRNVKIYRGKTVVDEIDVLVILGDKALIIQCKSKRLTELSRTGDTDSLKDDFRKAVQQAYDQGLTCRTNILSPQGLTFEADGLTLTPPNLTDAFIICVVSDHYPALTHQAHTYLDKKSDDPYPIATNLFDLEIMTFYLSNPFEFMYYIRQRIETADYFHASEEVALLAFHLRSKLFRDKRADHVAIDDSMAQLIDANFPTAKGQMPDTGAANRLFHQWKNADFEQLIADVQAANVPEFMDAIFMLYDMAGDSADGLIKAMKMMKSRAQSDGQPHSLAAHFDEYDEGVSYLVSSNATELPTRALLFGESKKYKTKFTSWLALGGVTSSAKLVDFFAYKSEPWQQDNEMEKIIGTSLKAGTEVRSKPKIGRNQPCDCGSGLKYKKCHGKSV